MTDQRKVPRAHITAESTVTVPVGRGFVDFQPGWRGPVSSAVADYLEEHGAAEIWRDGEPPAPTGEGPLQEEESAVRVIQTPEGPRFEDLPIEREPPPLEIPAADETAELGDDLEGSE